MKCATHKHIMCFCSYLSFSPFFFSLLSSCCRCCCYLYCLPKNSAKLSTLFHLNESFTKNRGTDQQIDGRDGEGGRWVFWELVATGKPQLKSFVCHFVGWALSFSSFWARLVLFGHGFESGFDCCVPLLSSSQPQSCCICCLTESILRSLQGPVYLVHLLTCVFYFRVRWLHS